ncbi:MAG: hypothetical protein HY291_15495 [Planctomycetes bacterium]|nr:hypothetical protein [Planctomycetota bacterium]
MFVGAGPSERLAEKAGRPLVPELGRTASDILREEGLGTGSEPEVLVCGAASRAWHSGQYMGPDGGSAGAPTRLPQPSQ